MPVAVRSWARAALVGLSALALGPAGAARAQEATIATDPTGGEGSAGRTRTIDARLSLSSMLFVEAQGAPPAADGTPQNELRSSSADRLLYGDLRGTARATGVWGSRWNAAADFRVRATGDVDDFRQNSDDDKLLTARGYAGGPEYDLRELAVERPGELGVTLGRQLVVEADATQIDGARLSLRRGAWEWSGFGGLYPDPYARTIGDDYHGGLVVAGGATGGFRLARMYGSFGATAIVPRGDDDGDVVDAAETLGAPSIEQPRVFVSASGYAQPTDRIDLFSYLVVDTLSEAGLQVTNGHLLASFRPGGELRLQASYHRMASLAIETYVRDLLEVPQGGTVENNLIVQRVARDEVRLLVDKGLLRRRYDVYADVRLRRRAALAAGADPVSAGRAAQTAADLAVGARGRGRRGLRYGAEASLIVNYRSKSQALKLDVGRDFLKDDRLAVDLTAALWRSQDDGDPAGCLGPADVTAIDDSVDDCFGDARQDLIDAGVSASLRQDRHWLFVLDYHFLVERDSGGALVEEALLAHVALLRAAYRF